MRIVSASIVAGLASVLSASVVSAAPLLAIDFAGPVQSGYTGFTGQTSGDFPGGFPSTPVHFLKDTVGVYTVTLASTNGFGSDDRSGYNYAGSDKNLINTERNVTTYGQDGSYYDGMTVKVEGLAANTPYEFTIYDVSFGNTVNTTWTPNIGTGSAFTITNTGSTDSALSGTWSHTATWTTNATGTILFGSDHTGAKARMNGFTVSAVPEPTTLGALGLGAMGLLARRRRMA